MAQEHLTSGLQDSQVNIRSKLSALWASVTLCYLYCDYFELYQPGKLQSMQSGQMGSQGVLLGISVLLAIPALMVALSLLLSSRLSRILHVVFGVAFTVIMAVIVPRVWLFYQFFGIVEIIITCTIVRLAWKWPQVTQAAAYPER